jgi:hypothetical protein
MKEKQTSIQISTKHRKMLKDHCEKYGLVMSGYLEKLIEERTGATSATNKICFHEELNREVKGNTPFGKYDDEKAFLTDCNASMLWAARKLGYPIVDIELEDIQFYACFEEAVLELTTRKSGGGTYTNLAPPQKNWIRNYFLALCKECLGMIRQKYETIPIPGGEVRLDGRELTLEARLDKEILLKQL